MSWTIVLAMLTFSTIFHHPQATLSFLYYSNIFEYDKQSLLYKQFLSYFPVADLPILKLNLITALCSIISF